jgi:hypothetical protein
MSTAELSNIRSFIKKRPYLIWYTRDFQHLSEAAILEAVLNYGDFDDVRKIIALLGKKKAAHIFQKQAGRRRTNYDPKIAHYFKMYFKRYAR